MDAEALWDPANPEDAAWYLLQVGFVQEHFHAPEMFITPKSCENAEPYQYINYYLKSSNNNNYGGKSGKHPTTKRYGQKMIYFSNS